MKEADINWDNLGGIVLMLVQIGSPVKILKGLISSSLTLASNHVARLFVTKTIYYLYHNPNAGIGAQ